MEAGEVTAILHQIMVADGLEEKITLKASPSGSLVPSCTVTSQLELVTQGLGELAAKTG